MKRLVIAALILLLAAAGTAWYLFFRPRVAAPAVSPAPASSPAKTEDAPLEPMAVPDPGGVAATVNGVEISRREYELRVARRLDNLKVRNQGKPVADATVQEVREHMLNMLIEQELAWQEASRQGYAATELEVEGALLLEKQKFAEPEHFRRALQHQQMTEEDLRHDLRRMLTIKLFFEVEAHKNKAKITDAQIRERYDALAASYRRKHPGKEPPSMDEMKGQIRLMLEREDRERREALFYQMLADEAEIKITPGVTDIPPAHKTSIASP